MSTAVSASTNVFAETCACGPKLFPTLSSEQYHETYNSLGHIDDVGAHNINQGVALTKSLLYQAGLGPFIVSHIGITRLHKHFDIASHEVVVSELSPCRSKMTSSVKNICDVGSEHVPMTWAYRQGAWRRIQLLRLPEETVEDGGISGNLRKQAAACETQLLRMIDGSADIDATAAWAEYATGPGGGVASQVGVSLRFIDLIKGFEPSVNMMLAETTNEDAREQIVQVVDIIASEDIVVHHNIQTHWFKGATVHCSGGCGGQGGGGGG
jgi:hypothetical protein